MVDSTCVVCGVMFQKRQRAKYCSSSCARFAAYLSVVERGARSAPGAKAKRAEWMKANRHRYRDKNREANRRAYYAEDGKEKARHRDFQRRKAEATFDLRRGIANRRKAATRLARAARGTTGGGVVWAYGPCHHCGETFTGKMNFSVQVPAYCSTRCNNGATKFRRRGQQAGTKLSAVRRYKVFERDGWMCRICGDPVDRNAKVPELSAPVIDHRTPLAAGGAHEESNWQTAHFYCNSVKRDQVGFDFAA